MITVVSVDFTPGSSVAFKYPQHGNRNILVNRKGVVETEGVGPKGPYVKVALDNGMYRTFSKSRIIDPVNA